MESFEDAYRQHYPTVVRSAWAICRDRARAEELAQEAFARAYRRWRRLERTDHRVAWLHRVAMNLAISDVRRRSRGAELEPRAAAAFLAHPAQTDPDWLVATLRRLPRRQREAVFLRIVADLSVDEVAGLMGCSTGSVKTHTSRGLDRLRELLHVPTEQDGRDGSARTATEAARG